MEPLAVLIPHQGVHSDLVVITTCYQFDDTYFPDNLRTDHLIGNAAGVRKDILRLHIHRLKTVGKRCAVGIGQGSRSNGKYLEQAVFTAGSKHQVAHSLLTGGVANDACVDTVAGLYLSDDIAVGVNHKTLSSFAFYPLVVDGLDLVKGRGMHHLHGTDGIGLEDAGKGIVCFLVRDPLVGFSIQRNYVERGQAQLVAFAFIGQGGEDVGAAGTTSFAGHV